jgi:sucrose phosphorylase
MPEPIERIKTSLHRLYGEKTGDRAFQRILPLIEGCDGAGTCRENLFSEKDIILICYGDTLFRPGELPLQTLHAFAETYLKGIISTIHFLPFFPYSSDDGFSVMDYAAIREDLGTWADVQRIGGDFKLMFDLVLNHVSAGSDWFKHYLEGVDGFKRLAIEVDPRVDLSRVVRPRSLPLLTEFTKSSGEIVSLWTTFSADQVDLNFKDLDVLTLMINILLLYVEKGAKVIRLDAIAYLWKEIGTSCIHLDQTHEMVKLLRAILDQVSPETLLITETNVPHEENVSYFGNGNDEAQMVYNFTLPPLLLYAFAKEDATQLTKWARGLGGLSKANAYFNFTASHDGIGVRPLEGILPPEATAELAGLVMKNNGNVSYKRNPDGSESPYEFNITYVDALYRHMPEGDLLHAERFLASQAIQLAFPGVPASYIHSLLGSRNWQEGVMKTGRARSINREILSVDGVLAAFKDPGSLRSRIFYPTIEMMKIRRRQAAFHPNAAFDVLDLDPRVFGMVRTDGKQQIYALTNISAAPVSISLSKTDAPSGMEDLITGGRYCSQALTLNPYQYVWLCEPRVE